MAKWKASDFEDTTKKNIPTAGKWSASDFEEKRPAQTKNSINTANFRRLEPASVETLSTADFRKLDPIPTTPNKIAYAETFKEVPKNFKSGNVLGGVGNALKGTGQMLLQGLSGPQKLIQTIPKGIQTGDWMPDPNLTTEEYVRKVAPDYSDKLLNTSGGQFATGLFNVASDPLTWVGGGIADDALKATAKGTQGLVRDAKIGENILSKQLTKAAKTKPVISPLNDNLSVKPVDNINTQPILPRATTRPNKSVAEDIGLKRNNTTETLTIKPGEGFADNVITEGKPTKTKLPNERGFSYNVRTDNAMTEDIRKAFDENPLTYEPLKNSETLKKAESRITGDFTKDYRAWADNMGKFDPSDIPLARKLANEAAKNGDIATARQIIADVSEKLTQSGQYSQAAAILRKSDPATFNTFIDNQLKKLNQQGREMYGSKWNDLSLTDDEMKQLYNQDIISEEEREKLMESIYNRISQVMPSSKMEKFDAWRRTAMLLNPKTHIRNVVGNAIMGVMRKSADTIGSGLEKVFLKSGERTKSFAWSLDSELRNTVDTTWKTEMKNLTSTNRYDINNLRFMNRDKRIFKNKALNALDKFSKDTLNIEDKVFLERAYKDALGGYMKANGLKEATQAAKDYAQRRSFEATFKQANFLSDTINKIKRKKGVGKLVEGAIPFTQTPANIMMRGVEYSPLGIVKALFGAANKQTGAQIIEDMAKGLTGTAALGAGYVLASMGAAKWQRSKSNTAAGLEAEAGEQSGSIMTPWGSYTFDWAQPAAIPLAMGISFYEGLQKKNASKAEALLNAISSGGDTIINMTMLKNIKDLFGGGGSATQKLLGIPVSYVEQAIPSLLGQIAKATDTTKRSTYDPNPAKAELNKIQSKIPGLSKQLPADRDIFGQTQDTGGWFQQFISPGYAKGKTDDPVTKELVRLYKANKETDFLPKYLDGSFSQDGVEYRLSAKELEQLKKDVGQKTLNRMNSVINSPNYRLSTDEVKMKQLRSIVNGVYNEYKNKYVNSKKIK